MFLLQLCVLISVAVTISRSDPNFLRPANGSVQQWQESDFHDRSSKFISEIFPHSELEDLLPPSNILGIGSEPPDGDLSRSHRSADGSTDVAHILFTKMLVKATSVSVNMDTDSSAVNFGLIVKTVMNQHELKLDLKYSFTLILMDEFGENSNFINQFIRAADADMGQALFVVKSPEEESDAHEPSPIFMSAAKSRQVSPSGTVVVLASLVSSLQYLARQVLLTRLLGSQSRLLVLSSLGQTQMKEVVEQQYAFSHMHTLFLNLENEKDSVRVLGYNFLPYSSRGPGLVRSLAWTPERGLSSIGPAFPKKYCNFHGATINVTALPFAPYWDARDSGDGGPPTYSGSDYLMIQAIAGTLNFRINVMPTANWDEVTQRVQERQSFAATVIYAVFPERLKLYDYSNMFEFAPFSFSMAKPALRPRWQALQYPLADLVWLSVLLALIVVTVPFALINFTDWSEWPKIQALEHDLPASSSSRIGCNGGLRVNVAVECVLATLLGQGVPRRLPQKTMSSRVLLASWLLSAFVVSSVYRSNLTASLTLPKDPSRAETLSQLVALGATATMPSYGKNFKDFFEKSTSSDFQKLSERIEFVDSTSEGLHSSLTRGSAHMEARRYLELQIAEHFTDVYGDSSIYVAKEWIFPGLSAWPVPHDAPYKGDLDRAIMAIIEGGLYEHWSSELLAEARRKRQRLLRRQLEEAKKARGNKEGAAEVETSSGLEALTLTHVQGPFVLLLLGWGVATLAFLGELLARRAWDCRK